MSKTRIPETIPDFDSYINTTDKYLQTIVSGTTYRWQVLGLSAENADAWHTKCLHWRNDLFPKYGSSEHSTSLVKAQVRTFMKDFRTFGNPILNGIAASPNAGSEEEIMFNMKTKKAKPSFKKVGIEETVMFSAEMLGGGDLQFSCRAANHSGRPKLAAGANSVQLAFCITSTDNNPLKFLSSGKPLPTPEDANMSREIFTRAMFWLRTGPKNVGKGAIVFARWYNTKHPHLSGPWSAVTFIVIG